MNERTREGNHGELCDGIYSIMIEIMHGVLSLRGQDGVIEKR